MDFERSVELAVPHRFVFSVPDGQPGGLPLLLALHGYGGDMVSMMRVARRIGEAHMIVASIQGPHQFWVPSFDAVETRTTGFGWLTDYGSDDAQARHHALTRRVIEVAETDFRTDRERVFLMGFSQACALNYRLAFTAAGLLRGVIGVCGGIPGDFDDPKYVSIPAAVLHLAATRDAYYPPQRARPFEQALRRLAADVTYREYDGGHVFPREAIPFIREWILARCARPNIHGPE